MGCGWRAEWAFPSPPPCPALPQPPSPAHQPQKQTQDRKGSRGGFPWIRVQPGGLPSSSVSELPSQHSPGATPTACPALPRPALPCPLVSTVGSQKKHVTCPPLSECPSFSCCPGGAGTLGLTTKRPPSPPHTRLLPSQACGPCHPVHTFKMRKAKLLCRLHGSDSGKPGASHRPTSAPGRAPHPGSHLTTTWGGAAKGSVQGSWPHTSTPVTGQKKGVSSTATRLRVLGTCLGRSRAMAASRPWPPGVSCTGRPP